MKRAAPLVLSLLLSAAASRAEITPRVDVRRMNTLAAQRSFLVPGLGQWYKGDKGRAGAVWALEASFLGLAAHSMSKARDAENAFRAGDAPYSRHTRKVDQANFFLLAAGGVWAYSIMDAWFAKPHQSVTAGVDPEGHVLLAWNVRF